MSNKSGEMQNKRILAGLCDTAIRWNGFTH